MKIFFSFFISFIDNSNVLSDIKIFFIANAKSNCFISKNYSVALLSGKDYRINYNLIESLLQ